MAWLVRIGLVAAVAAWLPCAAALTVVSRARPEVVSPQDAPFSCCDALVKPPPVREPPRNKSKVSIFVIERTGLQGSGLLGGDDFETKPALCLTATDKQDQVGGFGLRFQPCESSFETFGAKVPNNRNEKLKEAQQFILDPSGTIQSIGLHRDRLCVRRMRCDKRFLYDLGRCDGPGYSAVFEVGKAAAGSVDHLLPMGVVSHAVKVERCVTCGPYLLKERCLSRGEQFPSPHTAKTCGEHWQAKPGFTKMPTTYVGDDIANGRVPLEDTYDGPYDRILGSQESFDMAGMMATHFDGICGSYITDGPTMDSLFYLHRQV